MVVPAARPAAAAVAAAVLCLPERQAQAAQVVAAKSGLSPMQNIKAFRHG